jgi:hypothetical protein
MVTYIRIRVLLVPSTLAIVGSLLSLVGALVAVGAPQRRRKVAT